MLDCVVEKRLGFEDCSNLHRVLVKFLGLILLIWERENVIVFVELAEIEW